MVIAGNNFNLLYRKIVKYVLDNGIQINVRGRKTLECTNCLITLNDVNNDLINFDSTKAYERQDQYDHYRKREIEWYESGCLLAKHAPADFWRTLSGKNGKIQSNYGYLILHQKKAYTKKGITSYRNVLNILKKDKASRQAILHYNSPVHYFANKKDIPCTICAQVLIRNKKLNFIVFQRSADLFLGIPYDIPWHCYLLKRLVKDLNEKGMNIACGNLTIFIGSAHIYFNNRECMEKFLKRKKTNAKKK